MKKIVCVNRIACVAVAFGCLLATGCGDVGDPKIDRAIGQAEIGMGRALQTGGGFAMKSPKTEIKLGGGAMVAAGVALEQDGKGRIDRADRRERGEQVNPNQR